MQLVCNRMIKLYTAVIPDHGGNSFYAAFSFTLKHTEYLHEATLRNKTNKKNISHALS